MVTVLITNDDGPPNSAFSPFVYGLVKAIQQVLGWECLVVLPDSQKSWIGKAFLIHQDVHLSYYYPQGPDGYKADKTEISRPLKSGEEAEWILLGGTPATCSSIALHNLYPGKIDLVVSGPNFGRNTSSAFAMSSGTIGAALASSMSYVPSIALSYGIFEKPAPKNLVQAADRIACIVLKKLWESGFVAKAARKETDSLVDLYSVNIPLVPAILADPRIRFTSLAPSRYARLFTVGESTTFVEQTDANKRKEDAPQGGTALPKADAPQEVRLGSKMHFQFKPDLVSIINPKADELVDGTDKHAIHSGVTSVTPLKAMFAAGMMPETLLKETQGDGYWHVPG